MTRDDKTIPPDTHVIPIDDLIEHTESWACVCRPLLTRPHGEDGGFLVIHNAMDGRELVEKHGVQ